MHLDTVLKPATGFEVSTEGPDTQLFKKTTHAYTHVQTDSVTHTATYEKSYCMLILKQEILHIKSHKFPMFIQNILVIL